jgi:hypothetical protein
MRAVICLNSGDVFPSGAAAARHHHLSPMTVVQCCRSGAVTQSELRFAYADVGAPLRNKHAKTDAEIQDIKQRQLAGLRRFALRALCKKVRCIDDGKIYESITAAAAAYGKHVSLVSAAIYRKGRSGGRRFEFLED